MSKIFVSMGAIAMALAVALGAFGAHGLKSRLSEAMIQIFKTGVEYHFYHALGLIFIGILARSYQTALLNTAGWAMAIGIVLFSGSLYILAVTGIKWLGAITPIGGTAFIIGWTLVAIAVAKG